MRMKRRILMLLGLCFIGLTGTAAYANNHGDTHWDFYLQPNQGNSYTGYREKQDTSSSYVRVIGGGWGGRSYMQAWIQATGGREVNSPKTYCGAGYDTFITQYVYEWGYRSARMVGEASYANSNGFYVNGVWSPDSV